jgi:predicted RNase H-like HicB family nuclease
MRARVIIHKEENELWAEVPAIPGCTSRGKTRFELLNNLSDSLEKCLLSDEISKTNGGVEEVVELGRYFQIDPKDVEEGLAEWKRGETVPLDDAFAQIAGMSKEDWLKKVEAHKAQRRKPTS